MKYVLLYLLIALFAVPTAAQSPKPDRTAMYEDVEVMRRLLGEAVASARPAPTSGAFLFSTASPYRNSLSTSFHRNTINTIDPNLNPYGATVGNWAMPYTNRGSNGLANPLGYDDVALAASRSFFTVHLADRPAPPTDGTYVKGVGVLLTVDMDLSDAAALEPPAKSAGLAATCARCHGSSMDAKVQPPKAAAKRESADPWDAKLRQVRGEKEPAPTEPPATHLAREEICVPGHLTELVLNQLARYGHRFRELPANEAITVVVTLKGSAPSAADTPASGPGAEAVAKAEEQLALADLHAKQGKSDEAIHAYQKVVEILSKPLQFSESTPYDQVRKAVESATKTLRSAHGKLAQALLEQGKLDEAKAAIESAKSVNLRAEGEAGKKPVVPKTQLPIKLTIRVPKQVLDDHKAGRMTLDQVQSAAEVEAVGFAAPSNKSRP